MDVWKRKKRHMNLFLENLDFGLPFGTVCKKNGAHIIFGGECDLLVEIKILDDLLVLMYGELKGVSFRPSKTPP